MRQRDKLGEYAEEQGTVLCRAQAERYARAIRVAMAVQPPRRAQLAELARKMGFSRVHVSRVLAVQRSPTEQFLNRACAALGCDRRMLDTLAGMTGDESPLVWFLTRRYE